MEPRLWPSLILHRVKNLIELLNTFRKNQQKCFYAVQRVSSRVMVPSAAVDTKDIEYVVQISLVDTNDSLYSACLGPAPSEFTKPIWLRYIFITVCHLIFVCSNVIPLSVILY